MKIVEKAKERVERFISGLRYIYARATKPNKDEYLRTAKIALVGLIVIGVISLIVKFIFTVI